MIKNAAMGKEPVVTASNKIGLLDEITKLAAQNIDIKHLYGTACSGSCPDKLILFTSDNQKALVAFKKK